MAAEWYVGRDGRQSGPFSLQALRQMAASGELSKADLVWTEGFSTWVPSASVKDIFPPVADLPPTAPVRPAPRPTAPPPRGPASGTGTVVASGTTGGWDAGSTTPGSPNAMGFDNAFGTAPGMPPLALADYLPRVGAALLDGLFIGLISCIPNGVILALLLAITANEPQRAEFAGGLFNVCSSIVGFVIGIVYFVTLEASSKQGTWGKQIVGLKVTDLAGRRIGVGRAVGRFFARCISICTCGISYLLPLFTRNRQTLHDMISGCLVLKK